MKRRKKFSTAERRTIFDHTSGKCNVCHKQLGFSNYGIHGARGAWHVDHSVPVAKGGTDHGNNVRAVCIGCNLDKSTMTTRTARRWNGTKGAPLNRKKREEARTTNAICVGAAGASIGGILGGPVGALIGGIVGANVGRRINPDRSLIV